MTNRRSRHLLLPLLALSMSLALAATANAQGGQYSSGSNVSETLRINFGGTPRWSNINGTRVEEITVGQRPDFDLFRYNGGYYAYNNDRWYTSQNDRGDFILSDDRDVPGEFSASPRDHWRNYPQRWSDTNDRGGYTNDRRDYSRRDRAPASMQVNFGMRPRWYGINGTRIEEIRGRGRPDYDMFRYGGVYYVYNNGQWYTSRRGRGYFAAIDGRDVPRELARIPRDRWQDYPTAWMDHQRDPRYGNRRGNGWGNDRRYR